MPIAASFVNWWGKNSCLFLFPPKRSVRLRMGGRAATVGDDSQEPFHFFFQKGKSVLVT